jgi:hypothetical protein
LETPLIAILVIVGLCPACAALLGSLQELAVAVYAAPEGVVVVARGPDAAAARSCAEGPLLRAGNALRAETRGGRNLVRLGDTGDARFAPDATILEFVGALSAFAIPTVLRYMAGTQDGATPLVAPPSDAIRMDADRTNAGRPEPLDVRLDAPGP